MNPLLLSLVVATTAVCLIVVIGLFVNYMMRVYVKRWRLFFDSLLTLPLVLPPVVVGFGILLLFNPQSYVGAFLKYHGVQVLFTIVGAIIASAIVAFPLFYQSLRVALEAVDPDIEDVARTLGASEFRVFWTISLPLAWRGLVSGAVLSFCRALGEFGATILVAGNIPGVTRTLPLAIYSAVEAGAYDTAQLYVLYITVLTLALMWSIHFLIGGSLFSRKVSRYD